MKLLNEDGLWWWINDEEKVVSPKFNSEERARTWYETHDNWLERPAIL